MKNLFVLLILILSIALNAGQGMATVPAPELSCSVDGLNLLISWTVVSDATGYTLHYAPSPYQGPGSIASMDMGDTTSLNIALWNGASYFVAVTAYNDTGESGYSNIEQVMIDVGDPPSEPQITHTINGVNLSVNWAPVAGARGYTLHYAPGPHFSFDQIESLNVGNSTSFNVDLWEGAAFSLAVEAYNCAGASGYSNVQTFTIPYEDGEPPSTNEKYVFHELIGPSIWTNLNKIMAVDSHDNIYVANNTTVYRVVNGVPEIYVYADQIKALLGSNILYGEIIIGGLDVDQDDKLYILDKWNRYIYVSDRPGNVSIHRNLSNIISPHLFGVATADEIYVINLYDGLWSIKPEGNRLLYDDSIVLGGNNSGSESFAVGWNGRFTYIPGYSGTPLLEGALNGSGVGIISSETDMLDLGRDVLNFNQLNLFSSICRDPGGGYLVSFGGQIASITENGNIEFLPIEKDLFVLGLELESDEYAFFQRPIVKDRSGNIYVCSKTAIYSAQRRHVPL